MVTVRRKGTRQRERETGRGSWAPVTARRRCTHPTTRNHGKSLSRIWFLGLIERERERERPRTLRPAFTYLLISLGPRLHPPTPPAILVIRPTVRESRWEKSAGTPPRGILHPSSTEVSAAVFIFFTVFFGKGRLDDWMISREQLTFGVWKRFWIWSKWVVDLVKKKGILFERIGLIRERKRLGWLLGCPGILRNWFCDLRLGDWLGLWVAGSLIEDLSRRFIESCY